MTSAFKDPLMGGTRLTLTLAFWFFAAVGAFALLLGPVMIGMNETITARLLAKGLDSQTNVAGIGAVLVIGGIALLTLAAMARTLGQVVSTVATGDPFVTENANRLTALGWIALAVQALDIPLSIAADYAVDGPVNYSLDPGPLLLAVVLFILARVFRLGAVMRADLEGTV